MKRLQAQLTDAQKSLDDTKRDHQYDMMQEGYDLMSENAEKSLNSTLDALESNSAKQQEVVNEMLDKIKNSYSSAYSEINDIISETGTVISKEAQDAIDSLNNATDALNTANSAKSNPTENQSSNQVSGINTDEINTSTDKINDIESSVNGDTSSEIQSKTDEENARKAEEARLAAEAKAKAEAEAKAKAEEEAKAKAEEEARKKKLSNVKTIISSLPKSDVKKGSSAYKNHSELWRYIFDKSGKYTSEANMKKIAKALGITNLPDNISGTHKSAILKELKAVGYKKGTKRVPKDQLAWTQEDGKEEVIFRASDGAMLIPLNSKDMVFSNDQVQYLWEMSKGNLSPMMNLNTENMLGQLPEIVNQNDMSKKSEVNLNFESLITIESGANVTKEAIPGLKKEITNMIPYISDRIGVYVKNEMRL